MLEQATLLIIANHLRDIHNQLNSTILEARSHRPIWKVTKKKVKYTNLDGQIVEEEVEIVDKLSPLMGLFSTLEKAALNGQTILDFQAGLRDNVR